MLKTLDLPDYEPLLAAYHHAFAAELEVMIASLPIHEGDSVVELACGDGAYSPLRASRVGATGSVIAVDVSPAYLKVARGVSARSPYAARVSQIAAPIERLPLPAAAFDLVWCAQSLFSLPDPLAAIRTMAGLVRPGGTVAVLEDDTIHQLLLPWPPEVELAVRTAELAAFRDEERVPGKFYVGRRLLGLFREAGLVDVSIRAFASTRQAPLGAPERAFLGAYLADLRDRVAGRLAPEIAERFLSLVDPTSATAMIDGPDLAFTCLDLVVRGNGPAGNQDLGKPQGIG